MNFQRLVDALKVQAIRSKHLSLATLATIHLLSRLANIGKLNKARASKVRITK
jgi:hypothetical protein